MPSPVLLLGCDNYYMVATCNEHEIPQWWSMGQPVTRDGFAPPDTTDNIVLVFVDDESRAEAVLGGLSLGELHFLAVLTSNEQSKVTPGLLGNYLGCPAIDPRVALNFRDKTVQKRLIRDRGLPVSDFTVVEDLRNLPPDLEVPEQGGVPKPVTGTGTSNTIMVRTMDDIDRFASNQKASGSTLRSFLLEKYVKGRELVADGVMCEGGVTFFCLGEYFDTCLTAVTKQKALCMSRLDPAEDESLYAKSAPVIRETLRSLGRRDGVFHMELFQEHDTGAFVFSECAARRGGGLTQEEVVAKSGVSLAEQALLTGTDCAGTVDVKVSPGLIGMTYLPGRARTLISCPSPDDLMAQPGVRYARIDTSFGQVMLAAITNSYDQIGAVLLWASDLAEFTARVQRIREWLDPRTVIAPPSPTRSELRAWQRDQWPDDDFSVSFYLGDDHAHR